jgi:hypothetical protein
MNEQSFCRGPLAKAVNSTVGAAWVTNPNISFAKHPHIKTSEFYESGRPDGFIFFRGCTICIECKAAFGKYYFGNPDKKNETKGWTFRQREWCRKFAYCTFTPYYIAIWAHHAKKRPPKCHTSQGTLFLVPAQVYENMDSSYYKLTGTRYVEIHDNTVSYICQSKPGLGSLLARYAIPYQTGYRLQSWLEQRRGAVQQC